MQEPVSTTPVQIKVLHEGIFLLLGTAKIKTNSGLQIKVLSILSLKKSNLW